MSNDKTKQYTVLSPIHAPDAMAYKLPDAKKPDDARQSAIVPIGATVALDPDAESTARFIENECIEIPGRSKPKESVELIDPARMHPADAAKVIEGKTKRVRVDQRRG